MTKCEKVYYIPSAIDESVAKVILDQLSSAELEPAGVWDSSGKENKKNQSGSSSRVSKVHWINTDHWISGMMAHFIHHANVHEFEYDLYAWASKIQYTVYDTENSKYDWHTDTPVPSDFHEGIHRKLSISLCLTSDYEGGEFQILHEYGKMGTFKMGCGDVLVFSSDLVHRVKRVKSGKRISLVGWYGGPKFR